MSRTYAMMGPVAAFTLLMGSVSAFTATPALQPSCRQQQSVLMSAAETDNINAPLSRPELSHGERPVSRQQCLASAVSAAGLVGAAAAAGARDAPRPPQRARLPDGDTQGADYMELGGGSKSFAKPRIRYPDFQTTKSGLQFKDAKEGSGAQATAGDRVVMDWEGYTIGYNGNIFQQTKGLKGGAFDEEQTSFRFVVGKGEIIPGLEEGISGMKAGGVRQIVVPPELGYPESDRFHDVVGPKPTTFSGTRALDFVLSNPGYIDKTLLFTIRVVRVDKPGDKASRAAKK